MKSDARSMLHHRNEEPRALELGICRPSPRLDKTGIPQPLRNRMAALGNVLAARCIPVDVDDANIADDASTETADEVPRVSIERRLHVLELDVRESTFFLV